MGDWMYRFRARAHWECGANKEKLKPIHRIEDSTIYAIL
jgi:hypothetical protein